MNVDALSRAMNDFIAGGIMDCDLFTPGYKSGTCIGG